MTEGHSAAAYFRVARTRLYQPDPVLAVRLPDGVGELVAYCKTLAWVGSEYFGRLGRDFGSLGMLIVVGVKPGRRIRLWCHLVEGDIPDDVLGPFVSLLEGAGQNVWPSVTEPIAFALECVLGSGPAGDFPEVPPVWQEAVAQHGRPLTVPDELFEVVFPD